MGHTPLKFVEPLNLSPEAGASSIAHSIPVKVPARREEGLPCLDN
jgi:hypothetical protein